MGRPVSRKNGKSATTAKSSRDAGKKSKSSKPLSKAAQKREVANSKRDGRKYLEYMLSVYTKEELKPVEEEEEQEEEGAEKYEDEDGRLHGERGAGIMLCVKEGCKRKRGGRAGPCIKDYCFLCCHESRDSGGSGYCPGHYAMSVQKDTEERYIAEGLNLVKPKKTKFYHYEDKFTNYNQTVTVWCSKDFFLNRDFSGDAMADVERGRRNKDLLKRRQRLEAHGGALSQSSSGSSHYSSASSSSSSSSSASSSSSSSASSPASSSSIAEASAAWQKARAAHAKGSKKRFDDLLEKFREKSGKNKDSTAFVLR